MAARKGCRPCDSCLCGWARRLGAVFVKGHRSFHGIDQFLPLDLKASVWTLCLLGSAQTFLGALVQTNGHFMEFADGWVNLLHFRQALRCDLEPYTDEIGKASRVINEEG